ncbi:MAG: hypothetical protein FJ279_21780 [Planctomycetes bacterium]|nr:hypothetical protein [Planctomycetota bacterium]
MGERDILSVCEKLLLAAYALEQDGRQPFSAEDLVVAAWRRFPDTFGLAGHRAEDGRLLYPDSNRVFAEIMGSKGIRKRGFLTKTGNKTYQLTEAGREHSRVLLSDLGMGTVEKAGLPREVERDLRRLFGSRAMEKYRNGRAGDLTFFDACAFWGISPRSSANEFKGRMANLDGILGVARRAIQGKAVTFEHGGDAFGVSDLDELSALHEELLRRFHDEVQVISKRTDERA